MKHQFIRNIEVNPGEDYGFVFVVSGGGCVYAKDKVSGSFSGCDYMWMDHGVCATGPDGTAFEIWGKDKIEQLKV